jgi:polysaccharide pyruvyl transferase WcaK-like protein
VTTRDPRSLEFLRSIAPDVEAHYVPDALFAWNGRLGSDKRALAKPEYLVPFHEHPERLGVWNFQQPYICVGGSSEAAKDRARAAASYRRLLEALPRLGFPVVVTVSSTGDAFLEELAHELDLPMVPASTNVMAAAQILANAELVITGRYHPAILAGLGGVPCVLLGADSHKTASVQEMLGYPEVHVFSEQPSDSDVQTILERARRILEERSHWQAAISAAADARATESLRLSELFTRLATGSGGRSHVDGG